MPPHVVALSGLAIAIAILSGCPSPTLPANGPHRSETAAASSATPQAAEVSSAVAPFPGDAGDAGAAIPVGLSDFAPPPTAAVSKNDRGVASLANGRIDDAVRELAEAVALAPSFVLARYNLACADARAKDFDKARSDLEAVFETDFVGIRVQADKDSDLAEFWNTPPGAGLRERLPSIDARYRAVIDRGLPSILWHSHIGSRGNFAPTYLRVGVYDLEARRFVPVAPPMPTAFFGFSASMAPYAVLATGTVHESLGGDMDPGMFVDAVAVYPLSTQGAALTTLAVRESPTVGQLSLGRTGITYVLGGPSVGHPYLIADDVFGQPPTRRFGVWKQADVPELTRERPIVAEVAHSHWGYVVHESDPTYSYAHFALTLPSGRTIAIPTANAYSRAPARIIPSPRGDRVVLEWNAAVATCRPDEDIPGRFKLALVDTATGTVTSLGEGDGAGHAAFGPGGELFVQRGLRVYRVANEETELPEGVLLVPPLRRYDECGF